ncbi:MAG TPA: DnaJ domain-containing protein [Candidatus Limnocylindrales bacterium]|nr:DnaJ domain-containing protein [Candidatus Limnocylindrales bacterium]
MAFQGDPYRTLGVAPGASLNEIRSAYRRLVKQYHPDAAGERALPRFLAIQGAYEMLVDGEGRLRVPGQGPRARRPEAGRDSRADPSRARASRDAWRARRSGTGGTAASGGRSGAGPGAGRTSTGAAGGGAARGAAGASGGGAAPKRERPNREHHARRGSRTASPGSTTYDEAAEPLDPEWDGGAWYGPSSGTYWTINPREYADPRKHGPEYQARARRAADGSRAATDGGRRDGGDPAAPIGDTGGPADAPGPSPEWAWRTDARSQAGPGASTTSSGTEWGSRSWRYDDGPAEGTWAAGGAAATRRDRGRGAPASSAEDVAFPDLESLARRAAPRNLLALARGDLRWRLAIALIGWPPIGYAVATLLTEITGCAALSPSCPEPVPLVAMALQPVVVAALFLLPAAAAVAAFASLVGLAVALPSAAVLSIGSGPDGRVGAPLLGTLVAGGYLVGLAWGAQALWRARGDGDDAAPPGGGRTAT